MLALDLQPIDAIPGAEIRVVDFLADEADAEVREWLGGRADAVISDLAPAASGHTGTDHLRIMALCEAAAIFAMEVLEPGGTFVAKVLAGGAEAALVAELNRAFVKVAHVKPPASRKDSVGEVSRGHRLSRPSGAGAGRVSQPALANTPSSQSKARCAKSVGASGSQWPSAPSAAVKGTSVFGQVSAAASSLA